MIINYVRLNLLLENFHEILILVPKLESEQGKGIHYFTEELLVIV